MFHLVFCRSKIFKSCSCKYNEHYATSISPVHNPMNENTDNDRVWCLLFGDDMINQIVKWTKQKIKTMMEKFNDQ